VDDTDPRALKLQVERLRQMAPADRLRAMAALIRGIDELVAADLRRRHPTWTAREIHLRVISRRLPAADVARVYGFDPRTQGYL
jgi:hypothetical protein